MGLNQTTSLGEVHYATTLGCQIHHNKVKANGPNDLTLIWTREWEASTNYFELAEVVVAAAVAVVVLVALAKVPVLQLMEENPAPPGMYKTLINFSGISTTNLNWWVCRISKKNHQQYIQGALNLALAAFIVIST